MAGVTPGKIAHLIVPGLNTEGGSQHLGLALVLCEHCPLGVQGIALQVDDQLDLVRADTDRFSGQAILTSSLPMLPPWNMNCSASG